MLDVVAMAAPGQGASGLVGFIPFALILGIFYFLILMPMKNRQKKVQVFQDGLKSGDKIITSGGLTGTVLSVKDDTLILRVPPDNLKLEVARSSVVTLTTNEEEKLKS